jgi:glycine oxidase
VSARTDRESTPRRASLAEGHASTPGRRSVHAVAVVGAGIIGLSIAWRLVRDGVDVVVLDGGGDGAWQVAAGMLAPGGEAAFEHPALGRLLDRSAARWPAFVESLGVDVGYDDAGTLSLALTADDLAEADRIWSRQGLTRFRPSELRTLEPALSPRIRAGVYAPGERQVDPRRVVAALREQLGVRVVSKRVEALADVDAATVVVAAGCGTAALTGLPVRPVKGQVLRLRGEPGLIRHVLDATVDGRHVYVVPRADGEVVVGATQEERGDHTVTAGAVHELLHAALELVPELAELALVETTVGHRPGTPDNAPLLGRLDERVIVAAGHHRNGVLLAPVTADLIAGLIVTGDADPMLADFAPGRF